MPGFWKTLRRSLADSYDYLGLVLASSFLWLGVSLGVFAALIKIIARHPIGLFGGLAVLYVFLVAPLAAGVYVMAKHIVTRNDPSILDVFRGLKSYYVDSMALGLAQALVTLLVLVNIWFYLTHGGIVLKVLSILFVYLLLVWMLSSIYHYPLLIEQRPGAMKVIKRGLLLTVDNVAFTAGVFFVIILLTCFCAVTLLGMPLLYLGMLSILQTRALRALFVKYELLEPEREPTPEDGAEDRWPVGNSPARTKSEQGHTEV
jgi:uncharacterized membrane protein YesL